MNSTPLTKDKISPRLPRALTSLLAAFTLSSNIASSQTAHPIPTSMPRETYGIWDRKEEFYNILLEREQMADDGLITPAEITDFPLFNRIKGFRLDKTWASIETADGTYDWTPYGDLLDACNTYDKYAYASVRVGPDLPLWLQSVSDLTIVKTEKDILDELGNVIGVAVETYPDYMDSRYVEEYKDLIDSFADYLTNHPHADRIIFIQVMTGSTGDEVPFKGDLDIVVNGGSRPPVAYEIRDNLWGYRDTNVAYWNQVGYEDPTTWAPFTSYINSTLTEWDMFRLMAFDHFKTNFVDRPVGQGRTIPLAFNIQSNLQSETDNAQNWVDLNIGENYGIKGSAFVRAHHLTGEKEFKEDFYSNLVNPKELALFSRAEFDQTWRRPYVLTNLRLGIYWGMLGGLNTGLSLWDWTLSGVQAANGVYDSDVVVPIGGEHRLRAEDEYFGYGSVPGRNGAYTLSDELIKTIDFFNAHAGQIYPQVATSAYSIFHKGLNSNNAVEFPEANFSGSISKSNKDRYEEICAFFGNGANIDDRDAVVKGQVAQRKEQIGYNDSGWDIHEGNYERWIEQIDPDQTSNALYRLNAPLTPASPVYDRFARSVGNASGADKMYFKFNDEVFDNSLPSQITFKITWLDNGAEWRLRYDDGSGGLATAHSETGVNDGQWKTTQAINVNLTAASGAFNQGGPLGADFVIRNISSGSTDAIFHGIEVTEIIRHDSVSTHVLNSVPNNEYVIGEAVQVVTYAHNDTEISSVDIQVAGGGNQTATGPGKSQIHWFTVDSLPAPDVNGFVNIDSSMTDTASNTTQAVTLALDVDANKAIIRSPATGATFSSGDPVNVAVVGHHDNGIEKMRFRVQTSGVWGPYNNVNDAPYEYTFENLSVGQHILQVQMKSNAVGGSFDRIDSQDVMIDVQ